MTPHSPSIHPINHPFQPSTCQVQYDVLTRLLVPGEHYISVPLPPAAHNICTTLSDALAWAEKAKTALGSLPQSELRDVLIELANFVVARLY